MRNLLTYSLVALAAVSCAQKKEFAVKQPVDLNRSELFPAGTYQHKVHLELAQAPNPEKPNDKSFDFHGVVQIQKQVIKVVALSPFGTTLFKITDDRAKDEVSVESYVDSLKQLEPKFKEYYTVLRYLLVAPKAPKPTKDRLKLDEKNGLGWPVKMETTQLDPTALLFFDQYDANQVPKKMRIEHPKFNVGVDVVGYEI